MPIQSTFDVLIGLIKTKLLLRGKNPKDILDLPDLNDKIISGCYKNTF